MRTKTDIIGEGKRNSEPLGDKLAFTIAEVENKKVSDTLG